VRAGAFVCVGLGDDWGHRIVNATSRDKELGSQILQVRNTGKHCSRQYSLSVYV